ncbi:MAG: PqqD family protein [Gammaproteobacteria bacterium]|nr:PqqD family protein [Gammaproteobacteria bacterium]MDH3412000.1 PqqD family protein [Gammaproteobacteria bacterium]
MTITFNSRVRPASSVLVRELEGEAVLLNLDTESYYGLDEIGARMWSAVNASDSVEAACQMLVAEYQVDAERLREDLQALIEEWIEHGLARIDEG